MLAKHIKCAHPICGEILVARSTGVSKPGEQKIDKKLKEVPVRIFDQERKDMSETSLRRIYRWKRPRLPESDRIQQSALANRTVGNGMRTLPSTDLYPVPPFIAVEPTGSCNRPLRRNWCCSRQKVSHSRSEKAWAWRRRPRWTGALSEEFRCCCWQGCRLRRGCGRSGTPALQPLPWPAPRFHGPILPGNLGD